MESPLSALKLAVLAYHDGFDSSAHPRQCPQNGFADTEWTLIEQIEVGGERYALARRVDPPVYRFERLTPRERQVLDLLALGNTSKETAYELGIADATVRVLLVRATKKLRARGRAEAIARFVAARDAEAARQLPEAAE